jgi:hypothetical protein
MQGNRTYRQQALKKFVFDKRCSMDNFNQVTGITQRLVLPGDPRPEKMVSKGAQPPRLVWSFRVAPQDDRTAASHHPNIEFKSDAVCFVS